MLIGYMRVSTDDQNLDLQRNALADIGCQKVFRDIFRAPAMTVPVWRQTLWHLREADCRVVRKLDRLGSDRVCPPAVRIASPDNVDSRARI